MKRSQTDDTTPTILVVEDDESTGEVITLAIAQETSYHTKLVTNGRDALAMVQLCTPGLFILDYRLPDITGVELFDRLQAIDGLKGIPTIMMSATKRLDEIEARDVVLLDKPFELDEFLRVIENLIA